MSEIVHDVRKGAPVKVHEGESVLTWHFHEDLELGERYEVTLMLQDADNGVWMVTDVDKPARFKEATAGQVLQLRPDEYLDVPGELRGLWLDDRIVMATGGE